MQLLKKCRLDGAKRGVRVKSLKHFHFWRIPATGPGAAFPQKKPHFAQSTVQSRSEYA
jgi:hypothetical protein